MKFKLSLRQVRIAFLLTACFLLVGGLGYWLGGHQVSFDFHRSQSIVIERTQPPDKEDIDFSLFWDVWDRLQVSYLDKKALTPQTLVYGAIRGMVASLKDPYTVFLEPSDNQQAKEDLNGAFEGVGIQLGYRDGQLAVIAPLAGMPAEKLGVKAGDLILKIEDEETVGITLPEAVKKIRGRKGTSVKLTLLHEGEDEPYEVEIIREEIIIPSVEVTFIDAENAKNLDTKERENEDTRMVAHLKLVRFGERTNDEWEAAVGQIINKPGLAGVILDLRNNPGGYLSGSVFIASEFLPSGIVVRQENADGTKEDYSVNRKGQLINHPLVVLVNNGSASASEIVAGALKEYHRAKVVGETTFGKGTIQEAQDLTGGAGLHITTARWLLPGDKSIDKVGVKPDFEIEDNQETETDEQLEKAIEALLELT